MDLNIENFLKRKIYIWLSYHISMVVFPNPKIKVLTYLIENRNKEISIKKLSEILKLDYKDCNFVIKDLEREKIIKIKKIGNSLIFQLTNKFAPIVNYVEFLRKNIILKKRVFKTLVEDLELIKKPFICLLFGSYVKGNVNKNSDIDLLIITEDEKEINKIICRYPFPIHTTFINYEEFISMANNKEFSVVLEVLKRNIILIGIEEFYRVMKHVR